MYFIYVHIYASVTVDPKKQFSRKLLASNTLTNSYLSVVQSSYPPSSSAHTWFDNLCITGGVLSQLMLPNKLP